MAAVLRGPVMGASSGPGRAGHFPIDPAAARDGARSAALQSWAGTGAGVAHALRALDLW